MTAAPRCRRQCGPEEAGLLERHLRVGTRELARGLDAVEAALRSACIREDTVLDLRLVAEEVLTNVARHAHDDAEQHWIRLRLTLVADEVTLEFTDDGRPFDPLAKAPRGLPDQSGERAIGGLGIHLTLALVDAADYARRGSENVLTLTKRLRASDGDVP
jgi:anti-sigma regulatory factor (Ser/Thr protein kinase)